MKTIILIAAAILLSIQALYMIPAAQAATNLIANPSVETAAGTMPQGWSNNKWGTNAATFTYSQSGGYNSAKSLKVNMTSRSSGDAKWYFTPVTVTPDTNYTFSNYYKGTVASNITAEFQTAAGVKSYVWLGSPAAATNWTNFSKTFKTPANAAKVTIFHLMDKVGTLEVDEYALISGTAVPGPSPTVTPTPSVAPTPTPSPADPSNMVPNPSVETAAGAVPQNWLNNKWGTNAASFSYPTTGRTGGRSVRVDMTSRTSGDAKWYFTPVAVTPGATYTYSNYYQSNVATEVDAIVTLNDGSLQYYYVAAAPASPGSWSQVKGQFVAPANARSVTFMQIISAVGYLTTDDFSMTEYTPVGLEGPMISLTFDDAWRSIYTNGLPLLDKYGFKSTQYMVTGFTEYPDYMNVAMMQAFKNQGHEIASHTVSHPHLPALSAAQVNSELVNSKASLQNWTGAPVTNFATPYGEYNAAVLDAIRQNYGSHRSVNTGFNSRDNFDRYNILVQNVVHTTTASQIQSWVNKAVADKSWLVLVYHEIDTNNREYSTPPAELDKHLQIVKNSGASVVTVEQALARMAAQ